MYTITKNDLPIKNPSMRITNYIKFKKYIIIWIAFQSNIIKPSIFYTFTKSFKFIFLNLVLIK